MRVVSDDDTGFRPGAGTQGVSMRTFRKSLISFWVLEGFCFSAALSALPAVYAVEGERLGDLKLLI